MNKLLSRTLVGALLASSVTSVPASATPGSGFVPSPVVNGNFNTLNVNTAGDKTDKWGLILKTLDDTDIGGGQADYPTEWGQWMAHASVARLRYSHSRKRYLVRWVRSSLPLAHLQCG